MKSNAVLSLQGINLQSIPSPSPQSPSPFSLPPYPLSPPPLPNPPPLFPFLPIPYPFPSPPPLFPFLPIPYPLPLSMPATQAKNPEKVIIYRIAFAPPHKLYRTGLLFIHKNGCGGAISVTEPERKELAGRSAASPIG